MNGLRAKGWLCGALMCACALLAPAASTARGAAEPHPRVGKLPGFPVIRGVVPVLGSKAALGAREKLVKGAFAAARAHRGSGLSGDATRNTELAPCEEEAFFLSTQDVCYRGGPVLRNPTLHLIFWQGPVEEDISTEPHVSLFPNGYIETVKRYIEDIVHDNATQTNVFAVDPQYFDENAKGEAVRGEYALSFDKSVDLSVDNTPFPKPVSGGCADVTEFSEGPCLLDTDIQKEAETVAGSSTKGLGDVYLLFTPPGVGGCMEEQSKECAYQQYCAYHGDFGGEGEKPGEQTIYIDLPYLGNVSGCDSGVHPNEQLAVGAPDRGADAVIDTASHELNETITDPIGSQCKTGATKLSECEHNAWTDAAGQEIADKCLPPESTVQGTFGEPLGGNGASSFYNQLIDGDHYWTQRVWSNEAGLFEGGCVQRAIGASFTVSAGAAASVPMTLDGSPSGAPGDPATYWVWNFGGGEQIGTASPTISHVFATQGEHTVALTAYDAYGNAQVVVEIVAVGAAPIPPTPPPPVTTPPLIVKEAAATPEHFTVEQIAARLGLPASGKRLFGDGSISVSQSGCPPACSVTVRMYTKLTSVVRKHHVAKLVSIAAASFANTTVTSPLPAGVATPARLIALNAKGRSLLRKHHTLSCRLQVTVEGQEGGVWRIVRSLTLVERASTARRSRR